MVTRISSLVLLCICDRLEILNKMAGDLPKLAMVSIDWDLIDLIEQNGDFDLLGAFDRAEVGNLRGLNLLGADPDWEKVKGEYPDLKILLAIDPPHIRSKLYEHYGAENVISAVSKASYISSRALLSAAIIVQRGVTIMPHAFLGTGCKIHINATIHHESKIGDFCTIAPGAQILGSVEIGAGSYIGAGSIIRQRVRIGAGAKIGAGAVVVKDVPSGQTVVGVPADRTLKREH